MQPDKLTLEKIKKNINLLKSIGMILQARVVGKVLKRLKMLKLAVCITKGHLLSKSKGIYRIFGDYALEDKKKTLQK